MSKRFKLMKSFMRVEQLARFPACHSPNSGGYAMIHIVPRLEEPEREATPPEDTTTYLEEHTVRDG